MSAFKNISNVSRRAFKAFYRKLELTVLYTHTVRSFYAYVNSRIHSRPASPQLINPSTPNSLTNDPNMVSSIFDKYFGSMYTVDDNLPLLHIDTPPHGQMPAVSFDPTKIISTIHSIKSSSGPDKIHPNILKNLAIELSVPLSIMFTKSYDTSILPIAWKTTHVCPMFKSSCSRFTPENYGPVALTSVFCKFLESIIKDNILLHLSAASLLSPHQNGFLPKRSTLSALLTTTFDWLNSFCTYRYNHCVFFDLSQAFDSISHRKLLWKLSRYSMYPACLAWLKDFFTIRNRAVKIKSALSSPINCISGTPQGSVVSSLLFLIYVNDLPSVIKLSKIFLYVDNVKLCKSISSIQRY